MTKPSYEALRAQLTTTNKACARRRRTNRQLQAKIEQHMVPRKQFEETLAKNRELYERLTDLEHYVQHLQSVLEQTVAGEANVEGIITRQLEKVAG